MSISGITKFSVSIFLILSASAAFVGYKFFNPLKIFYPDFGISIPRNYSVHGIDVSRHQGAINWALVKAMDVNDISIDFVFIKATEGTTHTDFRYFYNWKKAKDNGIMRGGYHYFKASKDAKAQAKHFINIVKLLPGDMPPVLDFEEDGSLPKDVLIERLHTWLNTVERHYGIRPVIYVNINYYHRYIKGNFDTYPIWIAHYYKGRPRLDE